MRRPTHWLSRTDRAFLWRGGLCPGAGLCEGGGRRGFRCQPVCCSLRPARVAPDVVALGIPAADDGLRLDGSGYRIVRAQLELLSQEPAPRAAAPRNIYSGFVG